MKNLYLVISLFLIAAPFAVQSQSATFPSVTANPDVLYGCLATGKNATVCLGAMTIDCQAENMLNNENLEERLCVVEELNIWRGLKLQEMQALQIRLATLPADQHADLLGGAFLITTNAGKAWDEWHVNQCQMERAAMGNDPRRAIFEDTCMRDLTAMQFGRLRAVTVRMGAR